MFELVNVNLEKEMDEALHYVSKNLDETGNNPKPVLLHSFKMAIMLYSNKYTRDIIISGILHDLIEDTDVCGKDIEMKYGKHIRKIVEAVSYNTKIDDKLEQARLMFENCCKCGYEALIVKCADLLDNINFVYLVEDKNISDKLLKKYNLFLKISKEKIGKEQIYRLLKKKYNSIQYAKEKT